MIKYLREGVDPNIFEGEALMIAVRSSNKEAARLLLVNGCRKNCLSAWNLAMKMGQLSLADQIYPYVESQSADTIKCIIDAIKHNEISVLRQFVTPTLVNTMQGIFMKVAIVYGSADIISFLNQNGAWKPTRAGEPDHVV